jgi:hypothetical protein
MVSKILKLTLGTGDEHDVPLEETSTVTVKTRSMPQPGGTAVDTEYAYTNVVAAEVVDAPADTSAPVPAATAAPASPEAATETAVQLPLADAAAHVEKALAKFPDDPDLLALQSELDTQIRSDTPVWPPAQPAASEPAATEEPAATTDTTTGTDAATTEPTTTTEDATLASPAAAIDHAQTLPLPDAAAHVAAALAKFPDDPDLVAANDDLQKLLAEQGGQ